MGDRNDATEHDQRPTNDVADTLADEHAGPDDAAPATEELRDRAAAASDKLRNESDSDNASSETS